MYPVLPWYLILSYLVSPAYSSTLVGVARERPRGGSRWVRPPVSFCMSQSTERSQSRSTAVAESSRSRSPPRSRSPERSAVAGVLNQAGRPGELHGASQSTELRAGDWQCRSCGRHVYGSRMECKCGQPKALNAAPGVQGPFAAAATDGSRSRPGDWQCPGCGAVVYASKALLPPYTTYHHLPPPPTPPTTHPLPTSHLPPPPPTPIPTTSYHRRLASDARPQSQWARGSTAAGCPPSPRGTALVDGATSG